MVNKLCFIRNCTSSYGKENENCHFFTVPKLRLNEWQAAIPKAGLRARSLICQRHYEDSCIIKGKVIQNVFYAFKIWPLLPNAVPTLHLGIAEAVESAGLPLDSDDSEYNSMHIRTKVNTVELQERIPLPKELAYLPRSVEITE